MATPTLIQVLLGALFAALGIFGFFVSIFPAKTRKMGWAYFSAFAILTVVGVGLLAWQAVLAERSQVQAEMDADELRHRVDVLYRTQSAPSIRPTRDEIVGLQVHLRHMLKIARSRVPRELSHDTRALAAEIALFAAERAHGAPQSIPRTRPKDGSWPKRDQRFLEYARETRYYYDLRWAWRVHRTLDALRRAGVVEASFGETVWEDSHDPLRLRYFAIELDESASRLPKGH